MKAWFAFPQVGKGINAYVAGVTEGLDVGYEDLGCGEVLFEGPRLGCAGVSRFIGAVRLVFEECNAKEGAVVPLGGKILDALHPRLADEGRLVKPLYIRIVDVAVARCAERGLENFGAGVWWRSSEGSLLGCEEGRRGAIWASV